MRTFLITGIVAIAFLSIGGCNDNKQEPFKEWWAAERYEDYVPPTAQVVAEGTGQLSFAPTTYGTLYIVDLSDMRQVKEASVPHVIATGAPLPGSKPVVFDPNTATLTREGKSSVKLTKVVPGHKFQLRWQPNASTTGKPQS